VIGSGVGAWLGAVGGFGTLLVARRLPWRRRPSFDERVAPYLRDTALPSRLLAPLLMRPRTTRVSKLSEQLLRPLAGRLDRAVGGAGSIRARLDQLGVGTVEQIRLEQLVWGGSALGVTLGLGVLRAATGTPLSPIPLVLVCLAAGLAGVLARDGALTRQVVRRRERILAEFPTIAELLALSVAAGEGPIGALERVSRLCSGELGRELGRTLGEVRAGATLIMALQGLADRSSLAVLRRFVDGVIIAVERGSPMAEVLRAQAVDVREAGRRDLIETAARREVAMMVPVVFLVLPVSVLFALFPGFYGLTLTA
jgi:tight adherence protein C